MNSRKIHKDEKKEKKNTQPPPKKTLDMEHYYHMEQIRKNSKKLCSLDQDIQKTQNEIEKIQNIKKNRPLHDDEIDKHIKLIDKQLDMKDEYKKLQDKYNENEYFTKNSDILFKYYDIIENGNITTKNIVEPHNPHSILNYFKKPSPNNQENQENEKNEEENDTKSSLFQKYLANVNDQQLYKTVEKKNLECSQCNSKNISLLTNDGMILCQDCNAIEFIMVDHEKPSYKDPPKEISYYCYKRGNHLNELISQIQGKEMTEIPDEVYDKLLLEFKKQKISNMASLNQSKVRQILKKIGLNRYYEHVPYIIFKLSGMSNPNLEPELEEKIRNMFKQIQGPYLKYSPRDRKNFLSYPYVVYKFFELLEKDEYLPSVNLLKSRDKLMQQDMIWKKICQEKNWTFLPSL